MATTDIGICNTALIIIGATEINTFNDATAEAKLANSIYTDTKQMLLQTHPWRFSLKQSDLGGALVDAPTFEYKRKFQLPPDTLRLISIDGNPEYKVYGDRIYTDASDCRVIYQAKVSESDMPSYFVRCLQYQLAKIFAASLQEDTTKMQLFDKMANTEIARARNIDSQQQPNSKIPDNNYTLINIRG